MNIRGSLQLQRPREKVIGVKTLIRNFPMILGMSSIQVKNALIVTQNSKREILRGNVFVKNDKIEYIGKEENFAEENIDGSNMILAPGFINTHNHVAMAHFKGRLDDVNLEEFLDKTYKFDSNRTDEGIYNSSKLGMYEMIDSGTTSFLDLYYSEDQIAKAALDVGIRAFLSWVTLDHEYTTQKGDPIKNAENFIINNRSSALVTPSIGVQGIYVSSDETYHKAQEIARKYKTIVHTHLAETRKEVYDFVKKSNGIRPIEHLNEIGFLSKNVIAAHAVWATLREVRMLAANSVKVSWNAISNSKLAVGGIAPIPEMLENGVVVSLGTDSNGSNNSLNMFECMKFSSISIKNERWDASIINAQTILDMATVNAAASLNRGDLGSIEVGNKADLILVELNPNLIPTTEENAVSNLVYSANPSNVDTVIVDGKILKNKGRLVGFDASSFVDINYN